MLDFVELKGETAEETAAEFLVITQTKAKHSLQREVA